MTGRVVWKFDLLPTSPYVDMPLGATILSVGVQQRPYVGEVAVLWALCDPTAPKVKRHVAGIPTGGSVAGEAAYVGTFQINDGLVFHVFDGGERDG